MLKIRYHSLFKKDYKRVQKRGYDIKKLAEVIEPACSAKNVAVKI